MSRLMPRRRLLQSVAALSLPALSAFAQAQPAAFPSRPIKWVFRSIVTGHSGLS